MITDYPSFGPKGMPKNQNRLVESSPSGPNGMQKPPGAVKNVTPPQQLPAMAYQQQRYAPKVMQAQRYPAFNQNDGGIDWAKIWDDVKNILSASGEAINRNAQSTNDWWGWRSQQEQQYGQQNPQYPFWSGLQRAVNTAPQWIPNAAEMLKNTFK